MNPSYENGGQNIPGVKPGIIASGPDPEEMPPKSIATPAGLSIGQSRQPTGGRPMNMPVTTPVGGDTILKNDGAGSNKKSLIIGGVIAGAIILVLVVVFAVVMGNNGGGSNSNSGVLDSVSFNRLINYVTTGEESEAEITSVYDDSESYYFSSDFESEEIKESVYDKTKDLLDKFAGNYQNGEIQSLNGLVKTVKNMYDFMYIVDLKAPISEPDATKKIIENGETSATEELLAYYDFSNLSDNSYADSFYGAYANWVNALVDEVRFFRNYNCVSDSYMVLSCVANKGEKIVAEWNEVKKKVKDSYEAWGAYLGNADDFVANIYAINDLLQGKSTIVVEDGEDD